MSFIGELNKSIPSELINNISLDEKNTIVFV